MSCTQKEVTDDLRRRIQAGRHPDGGPDALPAGIELPTLDALQAHYGVARATAAGAVRVLARTGLVATGQGGRGRVVGLPVQTLRSNRYSAAELRNPDGSYTFEREMVASGWEPHTVYHRVGMAPAPNYVAEAFGIDRGALVVERIRRRRAAPHGQDGRPVVSLERTITIFESHLPAWVAGRAPEVATTERVCPGGTYALLADRGLGIVRRQEALELRAPTDAEAFDFGVPDLETVVEIRRLCSDAEGRVVTIDREVTLPWCVRFTYDVAQEA